MKLNLERKQWIVFAFTLFYVLAFATYYISIRNFEFLWYIGVIMFFFVLILFTLHRSRFDYVILAGLSLWGFLHLAGGSLMVDGGILYNWEVLPLFEVSGSTVLKFDHIVHSFGFGVSALVLYHLILPYLNNAVNWKVLFTIIVVAAAGLGALNEAVEFIAVIFVPETNVGGYTNTALDIVFNFLGAIVAVVLIKTTGYKSEKRGRRKIL